MRRVYKLSLVINIALLLALIPVPEPVHAQWPPFRFNLTPSHENGRITYQLVFSDRVDWTMTDVVIKVPLPAGTRFVETSAIPTVAASFDGAEVTFFIPVLSRRIRIGDAFFTVEITDPTITVVTAYPWIAWQGDQPGDYLSKQISIDVTRRSLNWEKPPRSRLQLEATATVVDEVITYFLYPKNVGGRIWDVKINVPMPEGTTFLSAEAPPPFVSSFDGREVSFSTSELARGAEIGPLSFKVSTGGVTTPLVTTHAWATWKNTGRQVGRSIVFQEETRTGDIVVQPHVSQSVLSDMKGDVPFSNYDITSIALQEVALPEGELALEIKFHTAGILGPVAEPLEYIFYIDTDCRVDTGQRHRSLGAEHWVTYRRDKGRANVNLWDGEEKQWRRVVGRIYAHSSANGKIVTLWVPYDLLEDGRQFCWEAEARNRTKAFNPGPPTERVPSITNPGLTQYEALATTPVTEAEIFTDRPSSGAFVDVGDVWQYLPGWSEPPPTWKMLDFDDSDWFSGATSIGYGDGEFATDLNLVISPVQSDDTPNLVERVDKQSGMIFAVLASGEDVTSLFMRRAFTVADPASLTQLALEVEYEGGFVAYLNGLEAARRGLGTPDSSLSYDALATDHTTDSPEVIDLSDHIADLVAGTNVLVIQAHRSMSSSNLSIAPKLAWESNPAEIISADNSSASATLPASDPLPSLSIADISGKLAVPLDNGQVAYDIHLFSLPDGKEIVKIPNARQPNFRFDGQRMLINRESGGVENLFEYNLADGTEKQVSDAPQDWHPFYDPWGNRVVYGNSELTVGSPELVIDNRGKSEHFSIRKPFIFVQCGLLPPHQEVESRCRNIPWLGVLVPAGQMGEIQGTHPIWTANDMIAYKGCNTWAGSRLCGIFVVPSSSTKGFSDGFIPRQLTRDTSDIPADTKGELIVFTSRRDGNWETYVMDLNGTGVENLSNSPDSNDGLPTISPDGNWVAFVSDRSGAWAIWVVPVAGGPPQKLFDLPTDNPWGDGDRAWTSERISWGP